MNTIELGSFATTVRAEDPVLRDHRVHGVRILPGVVYLDAILRAAMVGGYPPVELEIREALFHRPVALDAGAASRIAFRVDAATGRIRIETQRLDASGAPHGAPVLLAEALLAQRDSTLLQDSADVAELRAALVGARDLAQMYRQSGARGIEHREFMRATGVFAREGDLVTAELTLGAEARAHSAGFVLHPTFLDASTIVPFVDPARLGVDDESAFIPIYFGNVRVWQATPERVFVRAAVRGGGTDLLEAEVRLYDSTGGPVAAYRLTSKRVRGREDIERLLFSEQGVSASVVPEAAAAVPAPSGDPRAAITADLMALVAEAIGGDPAAVATDLGFYELGLDSAQLLGLTAVLESRVGEPLYPTLLFEYQTIEALAEYLARTAGAHYRPAAAAPVAPPMAAAHPEVAADPVANQHSVSSVAAVPVGGPARTIFTADAVSGGDANRTLVTFGFDWEADDSVPASRVPASLLVFDTAERPYPAQPQIEVVRVRPGGQFASGPDGYVVDPADQEQLRALLADLSAHRRTFDAAVYLWDARSDGLDPEPLIERAHLPLRDLVRELARIPDPVCRCVLAVSDDPLTHALAAGFARTARLEFPRPVARAVLCPTAETVIAVAAELAVGEEDPAVEIRYRNGRREVRIPRELPAPSEAGALSQGLVAVVTGGFGGIGRLLAERLARQCQARLVLVSRGALDESGARLLAEIGGLGGEAVHVRADISVAADVERVARIARATYGPIDAVFHAAGQLRDGLLSNTTRDDARAVLAPKVAGTIRLARAIPEARLLMLFSSVSAVLGNPGQADYAAANRFMDVFAEQHAQASGHTRVISVGWPIWADGGMRPPADQIEALRRMGIGLLPSDIGLDLLTAAVSAGRAHLSCAWGEPGAIRTRVRSARAAADPRDTAPTGRAAHPGAAGADQPDALTASHAHLGRGVAGPVGEFAPAGTATPERGDTAIAIVGFSGRFPGADDIDEFWRLLRDGVDAVGPVPAQRWWLGEEYGTAGRLPTTGGFLRDVAGFDPQFFRIPPAHAPLLDPQERLFLQQAYAALEHAGYQPEEPAVRDRRVGVFVGATWSDYRLLGVDAARAGDAVAVASLPSSIANRVSYSLGLRGPSLTVDTACSASLTALHLARRSLLAGECDAAVVGGVNLLLHPDKFLLLRSLGMMSSGGRCRPFGAGADGYVPGEGVGALYLKPLRAALADGDTIHGVVLGSAVNHGGHTAGYSVPHPSAQAEVIAEALGEAGLEPGEIDYIEAHGTGTALGDPIEINGLTTVFGARADAPACVIGSTKSNIGHLEAAAGIAGLTRVLLQFRHGGIAPALHAEPANPAIDFDAIPFRLPQRFEEWPRRAAGTAVPRRAGVSAFGAGGANAHVVLAEHFEQRVRPAAAGGPEVFVLSARTGDRLHRYAETMARHLRALDHADFSDAVRTLQVGRPALAHRLAVVAATPHELADALDGFLTGRPGTVYTGTADPVRARSVIDPAAPLEEIARQWVSGAIVDWASRGGPMRRLPLPGYPFERNEYWISTPPTRSATGDPGGTAVPAAEDVGGQASVAGEVGRTAVAPTVESGIVPASAADVLRRFDIRQRDPRIVEPGQAELARYAALRLFGTLTAMGLAPGVWPKSGVAAALDIPPRFRRLLSAALGVLVRHRLIRSFDGRVEVTGPAPGTSWMRADLIARYPETEPYAVLLDTCLDAYPAVLRGTREATEVLFPGGDFGLVGDIYRGNPAYDFANSLIADLIAAFGAGRTEPLRVLEVGAGTGGTTHAVLAALTAAGVSFEYRYTDVSHSFVAHGRRTFGGPQLRFDVLDISEDPGTQGFPAQSADVVLCANVLHATPEIIPALRHVRRLLAPGGMLALFEVTSDVEALALTFGLLDGWHAYRDPHLRLPDSPLLSEQGWRAALAEAGFTNLHAWGPDLTADPEPSFRVLAGISPDTADAAPETAPARAESTAASGLSHEPRQLPVRPESAAAVEAEVTAVVAEGLGVTAAEVRAELPLSEYGVDSILAVKIVERVNARYGITLRPTVVFDHPSVRRLSLRIIAEPSATHPTPFETDAVPPAAERHENVIQPAASEHDEVRAPAAAWSGATTGNDHSAPTTVSASARGRAQVQDAAATDAAPRSAQAGADSRNTAPRQTDIAIIGMSGRFPGAADLDEFWRNLATGHDSVTEVPPARWSVADYFRAGPPTPGRTYSKWGGFLDDIEQFDPAFFDIVPAEADYMDPQQRLFLEHSWLALEDAAIDPRSLRRGRCGVFAGSPGSDYATLIRDRAGVASHHVFTGNSPAILPARIAYHLDLTGPCVGLDTACSSALVAIHQACRSLAAGDCDIALAGAVAVFVTPEYHLLAASMGMLSPRGRCAAFGADADGFVIAEGVGTVVLKPLAAAERDGDPIHGVIRGVGVNHDGRTNGITAPSGRAQTELQLAVYRDSGIDPATIGYVETHGTGTKLGDPIEFEALTAAFRDHTAAVGTIPIGSVKSNVGHTSHAAGVASLCKVLLAMRAGQIPPSLHADTVNPLLDVANSPFFVNTALREWPGRTRRAAISSFGFSGTNAHLVVDGYQDAPATRPAQGRTVVVLSARTPRSLRDAARALARHLAARPDLSLPDVAHTLAAGRTAFEHRAAVVADSLADCAWRLMEFAENDRAAGVFTGSVPEDAVAEAARAQPLVDADEAARRWVTGAAVEFAGWSGGRRIHLPGYQFARERCWLPEHSTSVERDRMPIATDLAPDPAPAHVVEALPASADTAVGESRDDIEPVRQPLWRLAETYLKGLLATYGRLDPDRIRTRIPLQDYGIDSVMITTLTNRLETDFGSLPSTLFFEYRTLRDLAGYLAEAHPARVAALGATTDAVRQRDSAPARTAHGSPLSRGRSEPRDTEDDGIAIIGMAGRFPMARDIDEFWANLVSGRDCIIEVPPQRWDHSRYLSDDPDEPGTTYARWGGFIDDVDAFDARFFGVTGKDAEEMDPQQRLFLETSWAALEDAGYPPERLRASARSRGLPDAGVFAGVGYAEYQAYVGVPISGYFAIPNKVSYHFGFTGPSLAVDTACSASLTAIHLACESLRRGEAGYALAGGVNVSIHPGKYQLLGYGRWASSDGRCRAFGAGGDGYVPGEGVVTLVLKPVRHARADGDRIYGVIRGTAVNHGGHTNGFTVPNPQAQAELIGRTLDTAGIDARDIGYVEAHGTGTALGDPIEIAALTAAYRRHTAERGYCGIGSAKSSVGHLEAAAGAAGVVKALLQLRHDTMAPTLHSDPRNPGIDFAASPFRVVDAATPWPRPADGTRRVTAVSSFGAGGANAHVILTDGDAVADREAERRPRIVVLSARDADRLAEAADRLARQLRERPSSLADVAWTLAVGRAQFTHRLAVVAESADELLARLAEVGENHSPAAGSPVFRGVARTHRDADELPGESETDRDYLRGLLGAGKLARVAELWASGWVVDWADLYGEPFGRIVSLPTYPFARQRYWIVPEDYQRRTPASDRSGPDAPHRNGHIPEPMRWSASSTTAVVSSANGASATRPGMPAAADGVDRPDVGHETKAGSNGVGTDGAARHPGTDTDDLRDRLRGEIRDIFADLTKTDPAELDFDADFTDFGFDSVATVRMLNRLMKQYDVRIPAQSTEQYPTIRALADYLVDEGIIAATPRATTSVTTADDRDTLEHSEIPVVTLDAPVAVESVFITGVTGVLGGKLLHDLLATTAVRVTCLVRGESVAAARSRVKHFLDTYDPDGSLGEAFEARVSVVLGDVSQDRLGLDEQTWQRLPHEVDLTVHVAGRTTLVTFYDALAPINVEGTRRAIDFALRSRGRYLVYVSSFSMMGDRLNYDNPPFTERDLELGQGYDHLPYQQTKYESEKLVRAASEQGLLWDIVRPGNIMGDGTTGRYPFSEVSVKGVYYDILKTMIETGETMLTPVHWDITPVDYVTAGILHIALRRPTYRETYHLTNPDIRRYYDVVHYVREAGYGVDFVPLEQFHARVTEREIRWRGSEEPYDSQTLEMFKFGIEIFGFVHYQQSSYADCAYTRRILRAAGIDCPTTEDLVRVYLAHCAEAGYLPPPRVDAPTAEAAR
ncbi:SDR family NAD(P)-dependent oxidoreductase [Nocardia sp. CA-119907]|uniref:SDR family NAD(P)-dependent oxidoreductase n=1 Tax=Nocardia sp. CA-119907 TaxID=3239973 RepID=UPI003D956653